MTLKPHVSIPALQEFTICLHLKFEVQATSPWTAFIYHHPDIQYVELGLGGEQGRFVVWLLGTKWTTSQINLSVSQWFSVCLTWSHRRDRPALYIRGVPVGVMPDHTVDPPPSSYPALAANGTLVLGVGRPVRSSNIQILPFTGVFGKISLFRLWGRERNKQEVTSLYCTEGDLVNWETDSWDTQMCPVVPDPSLQCEWSFYEVRMMFVIICYDGNNAESYTAREMAHHWIREVLPTSMYLNRVSVFEVQFRRRNPVKPSHEDKLVRWVTPNINRFQCLVHVSVIPSLDVSALNSSLPDDMMMVLDFQLFPKTQRYRPQLQSNPSSLDGLFMFNVSRVSCVFQVHVLMSLSDSQEMEEQIRGLLLLPYDDGSVTIATEDIEISRILILKCDAESHQTRRGLFQWPDTSGGKHATRPCPKNPRRFATRLCKLCLRTHWMDPDLEDCPLVVETIPDLDHIQVTAGLQCVGCGGDDRGFAENHSTLSFQELVTVLNKLEDIVDLSVVTPNLAKLSSTSSLTSWSQTATCSRSPTCEGETQTCAELVLLEMCSLTSSVVLHRILNITEAVGDRMVGYEGSSTLVASAVAISVVDVAPGQFNSLTFGVSSDPTGTKPEIFINRYPFNDTVAFISLPSALQHSFPQSSQDQNPPRVQFQFYSSQKGHTLNTFVVSASVTNATAPIKDLDEHVKVTLHHLIPNTLSKDVQCVYWNFNKNYGHGGWDDYGCRKHNSSSDYTTCLCDHLTHFGVLLDVSRTQVDATNEQILTIITYLGCGVSSLFLGVTEASSGLSLSDPHQPLPGLVGPEPGVLGQLLVVLLGLYTLCVAAASTLHYFLLTSFTWMGLEAVNMYFALVKVFNVYVPSYILKFCAVGWGLPLIICILVLIVNREAYGSHLYTDGQPMFDAADNFNNFCWLQDNVTFYVSVVAFALLVFLFNIGVFVVVLIQIRHMRVNSPAGTHSGLMHDLKGVASLTLLLGLTWTVGFFTFGPARMVLLYLFSGLNSLQGLFIFIFHCLMKENVRNSGGFTCASDASDLRSTLVRQQNVMIVEQLSLSSCGQTQTETSSSIGAIGSLGQVQLHREHVSLVQLQPERLDLQETGPGPFCEFPGSPWGPEKPVSCRGHEPGSRQQEPLTRPATAEMKQRMHMEICMYMPTCKLRKLRRRVFN
ncbi:hypothetical protein INR49_008987 [Caranx melampygus]|nr:hypothetical protein INR49_008987 [Caranx melampygus]